LRKRERGTQSQERTKKTFTRKIEEKEEYKEEINNQQWKDK
jgi:hypothetical protein